MLQKHSIVRASIRKYCGPAILAAAALILTGPDGSTASKKKTTSQPELPVLFLESVPIPVDAANTTVGMFSFDISFVDQTTQTYYLADRSNKAVDVVDASADMFVTQVSASPAFAGVNANAELAGPNGVLTANGCIIATDANNRVVSHRWGRPSHRSPHHQRSRACGRAGIRSQGQRVAGHNP